ncbi:MAG: hypothetical protein J6Y75_01095 [Spirochaetaceae bacterium]|nr:hypothetical protein [Spirochaetaceae bacterium]
MIQNTSVNLTQNELNSFITILTERTGIIPRASHLDGIKNYIQSQITKSKTSVQEYKLQLMSNPSVFADFVNGSTVNETYFFREEKQFALLHDKIFPQWRNKSPGAEIKMWSAACSYGEEAYSLALLAKACGIKPCVTASDINSDVLKHCRQGLFLGTSLRSVDGSSFQNLIFPYKRDDGKIDFDDEIKSCIKTMQLNLSEIDSPQNAAFLPKNQNIIFLRNVFIYFSQELRARILRTLAEKCLAEDGLLFVSMSEIAQTDSTIIPPSLEKNVDGSVFYFHKKTGGKADG